MSDNPYAPQSPQPGGYPPPPSQPPPSHPGGGYPPPAQPSYGQAPADQPAYGQPQGQPPYGQPTYGQSQDQPSYGQPQDQPSYGQPQGQPSYGQPQGQPSYGQQPAGQPSYGQDPAGQPQYGQPAGQPQYGQPAGQPGFGDPAAGQPPMGQPPRKSSAGKIVLIVLSVVLILCVGGAVTGFVLLKDDVKDVVEATGTRVVEPETLGGRAKITDPTIQTQIDNTITSMKDALPGATSTVGRAYGDVAKQEMVMVMAVSHFSADPEDTMNDALSGMRQGGLVSDNMASVDPGPLGGVAKCGDGSASGIDFAICSWTDKGSWGAIIYYFKKVEDLQPEFVSMRGAIEQP
ncbi:hypothetical protein WEI85_14500 [Actinomycetes bacterium KLBMP 9797]